RAFSTTAIHREQIIALYRAARHPLEGKHMHRLGAAALGDEIAQRLRQPAFRAHAQPHFQKSLPSLSRLRDNTILCTSEAPSTTRAGLAKRKIRSSGVSRE